MTGFDQRHPSNYGFVHTERWLRLWSLGFLTGFASLSVYFLLLCMFHVVSMEKAIGLFLNGMVCGLNGLVASPFIQIIFCGYILELFKNRCGMLVAISATGLLFSMSQSVQSSLPLLSPGSLRMATGHFVIMALLSIMRIVHGNIYWGTGVLTGWIMALRIIQKTAVIPTADKGGSGWIRWTIPEGHPEQGVVLWVIMGLAIGIYAIVLQRRGEPAFPEFNETVPKDLKRIYPFAQPNLLAPMDVWLGRLRHARFRVNFAYLPRLISVLSISIVNTLLTLPERLLFPLFLRKKQVRDPIFIVGVHRSGTTHLHNLLSLDHQWITPRLFQVMNPNGFVFTGWLLWPLFLFSPPRRPMDSMRLHVLSPSEEEFALMNQSNLSPYWGIVFPKQGHFYDRYLYPEGFKQSERESWKRHYTLFLKRLTLFSRKRPLLKNPVNTSRIGMLREMYPKAKFIHIHRNPYHVYRSYVHMVREGFIMFQLQDPEKNKSFETRFPDNYLKMEDQFERDAKGLPKGCLARIRFEDLEADPIAEIDRIYTSLHLQMTKRFRQKMQNYLKGISNYQKNRLHTSKEESTSEIHLKLESLRERNTYPIED